MDGYAERRLDRDREPGWDSDRCCSRNGHRKGEGRHGLPDRYSQRTEPDWTCDLADESRHHCRRDPDAVCCDGNSASGTQQDISSSVTWISTRPAIATIISGALGPAGWVTGIAPGGTFIGAGFGGQFDTSFPLTVTGATLSSVAITPSAPQGINLGMAIQYTATGTFSDSSTEDLTNEVAWSSSDPTVAIIDEHGLATSTGSGVTTVKAAADINGVMATDSKMLTVAAPK